MIIEQTRPAVNTRSRLEDAWDNRATCIREARRAERLADWAAAAAWRESREQVEREIQRLTNGRGW